MMCELKDNQYCLNILLLNVNILDKIQWMNSLLNQ